MEGSPAQARLSKSALVGFIFALLGFCFPPFALVGLVLGIIALVTLGKAPNLTGKGLAIASVVISPIAGVFGIGVLAAIAIPNFMKYQARAASSEARVNVHAIRTGVVAARGTTGKLPDSIAATPARAPCGKERVTWPPDADPRWRELGFEPAGGVRYQYEYQKLSEEAFVVRARGDLDCDGKTSLFEMGADDVSVHAVDETE